MKIIFAVFDYLHTDYRVYKTANSFIKNNYDIKLYGITDKSDKELLGWDNFVTDIDRLEIFKSFPLKINMIIFWFKLFFKLLFSKEVKDIDKDTILYCHDIFPLLPIYLISKIKRIPFIYDSHEFTYGNHHYENRPFTKFFWRTFEKFFIKGASKVITVSQSIADEMEVIYSFAKGSIKVITNLPLKREYSVTVDKYLLHKELGIDLDKKIVLYQGGLLFNNGLEVVIKAFKGISKKSNDLVFVLIGNGSRKAELKRMVKHYSLESSIFFKDSVPQSELFRYTTCAYLGICLIKNSGKSFYYSTPNKMFEYIQAGVPQLSSNFPEIINVVDNNNVGIVLNPSDSELIANTIINITDIAYKKMVDNCFKCRDDFYWENLENSLIRVVEELK